jgi:hypothetical protein
MKAAGDQRNPGDSTLLGGKMFSTSVGRAVGRGVVEQLAGRSFLFGRRGPEAPHNHDGHEHLQQGMLKESCIGEWHSRTNKEMGTRMERSMSARVCTFSSSSMAGSAGEKLINIKVYIGEQTL